MMSPAIRTEPYGSLADEGISPEQFLAYCERRKGRSSSRRARWLARLVMGSAPGPGPLVVEVGCGGGFLVRALAKQLPEHARIFAIDPDPVLLDYARAHPGRRPIQWLRGRVEDLPFCDGQAALVICEDGIHHWASLATGLSEIRRSLAPGGIAVLMDLDPSLPATRLALALVRLKAAAGFGRAIERAFARSVERAHPRGRLIEAARGAGLVPFRRRRHPMSVEILTRAEPTGG